MDSVLLGDHTWPELVELVRTALGVSGLLRDPRAPPPAN